MAKYPNPRQHWACCSCRWAINWDFVREAAQLREGNPFWLDDPDFGLIVAAHIDEVHPELLGKTPRSKLWRASLAEQLVGSR